ncbi:MAG TPA: DUF1574 family protein [Gemmataceae bacterium]|nr:DUF1574 family protein [Gemmataceae bacterium]
MQPTQPRRAFLRRARGTLLLALGAFVLTQLGLRLFIDEWKPELRDPIFEIKYRQLANLLGQHPKPAASVVFFGSSMSANGMKAGEAEAPLTSSLGRPVVSYNLATNGAGPVTHLVYMQRLLRRGVRPDMVVLEVSPLLFVQGQVAMDISRFPADVLEREDIGTLERYAGKSDLRDEWWKSQLVPTYAHRRMILNQSAPLLVPFSEQIELWPDVDAHGWRGRRALPPEEHRVALQAIEAQLKEKLQKFRPEEEPRKGLNELADLLTKEHIQAVLVVMPEGPFLRSLYAPNAAEPMREEFRSLCRRHGFTLVDAHEWYDESQFVDSYHLHASAAQEFTERLVREGLTPVAASTRHAKR